MALEDGCFILIDVYVNVCTKIYYYYYERDQEMPKGKKYQYRKF